MPAVAQLGSIHPPDRARGVKTCADPTMLMTGHPDTSGFMHLGRLSRLDGRPH